ncbi:hypothetical protein Sango_1607300 [Sesamum angolense]|uniref:Helitron helicase-like domain-containing protein n=1 Tax=Sesamum angolense TaxID=2727404 RepID=A0AAE1WJE9_9LAMI|nr:hypothetical protein Sango_1607300 [Sesamum angolense]
MESEDSNMDIDGIDTQVERTREQNRVRARQRRQRMSTEGREVHLARRRQNYQQQRQIDENDASIQESMQRRREINRIRSRERRERMTTEQREVYLARRRHLYHLRRGNNTIPAVAADVNAYQTTSRHTQALHIEGNQGVVPLARSIPIPLTIADGNRSVTSTSVAQTSGSAINTTVGTTLLRQIPLANFAQVPANQLEASTSRAQPSNNRDNTCSTTDRVVGNISLRHIPAPNFDRVPPNQFEASTSRARPSNSGDHDNNDYNLSSSSSDDLHNPPNVGEGRRKVMLPEIPVPVDLIRLFTDQSAEGRIFRQNIRAYNHVFSFTSLGVALDQSLAPFDQGIYTFRAHGSIYHRIGSLLPLPGTRPRYIQMFIYDTEHEIENRLQESNGLDGELVDKVRHILDAHNPFVKTLRQLAQRPDINIIRGDIPSILLHGGRLLQQYVVDNYVKIETQKLRWVRFHQHDIRAELYEGLQDCLDAGENDAGNVGRRTILPSSFIGSHVICFRDTKMLWQ